MLRTKGSTVPEDPRGSTLVAASLWEIRARCVVLKRGFHDPAGFSPGRAAKTLRHVVDNISVFVGALGPNSQRQVCIDFLTNSEGAQVTITPKLVRDTG